MSPVTNNEEFAELARHLAAGKYFQLAAFVMLIYDHLLTFADEVERIWKPDFSGATVLFLINRYLTPIQFIIIVTAFQHPGWVDETCVHFMPNSAKPVLMKELQLR
ncbi:hypothetical protein NLJ89_g11398 [Agrocybe chaxingu]|uniref:DUF6533 domain-containing protein n=1 Tax=Agrocybe chaxingu TaxID=84603 RepID=A0A9W8MN23_9AGAR|nr:hypothetical protein NLJ89_g11398 [Agrocybe chaxingu]